MTRRIVVFALRLFLPFTFLSLPGSPKAVSVLPIYPSHLITILLPDSAICNLLKHAEGCSGERIIQTSDVILTRKPLCDVCAWITSIGDRSSCVTSSWKWNIQKLILRKSIPCIVLLMPLLTSHAYEINLYSSYYILSVFAKVYWPTCTEWVPFVLSLMTYRSMPEANKWLTCVF